MKMFLCSKFPCSEFMNYACFEMRLCVCDADAERAAGANPERGPRHLLPLPRARRSSAFILYGWY